jgi:hypothetical protein
MTEEYKEKEETGEIKMPEIIEEVQSSQLEIEATEEVLKPLKSPVDEDTRILTKEEQEEISKLYREKEEKSKSVRILLDEADKEHSREYTGEHIYVWYKKDPNGEWRLHHTYPENLKFRLQIRRASVDDKEVVYGGKVFKKFADFEYNYKCRIKPKKGCKPDDYMRVNKYSLNPDGEEETKNRGKCETKNLKDLTQRTSSRF